jgi:acyl carrier protein
MNSHLSEQTSARVRDILRDQLSVEPCQITSEADLTADLGADSLDKVEIGMMVEETFNIVIPDEAMEKVQTVGDLQEALAGLLEQTGQPA